VPFRLPSIHWRLISAALLALAAAACGGGGGSAEAPAKEHENTAIDTAGRLALTEDAAATLRLYDLDGSRTEASMALANVPSAVYASPGGRYALAVQRAQDTVQIADGGIWQEDHGDHLHDYKSAPSLLALRINGPQPTHYDDRAGQATFFMDGRATTTPQQPSSAVLFSDASIARGTVLASLTLASAMHGFAEPNGSHLVASYRDPAVTGSPVNQVEIYRRDGAAYSLVQRLDPLCPGMHGSYTRGNTTVAGCSDGALLTQPDGAAFAASKIAAASGISTIAGHARVARFVGIGNTGTPSTTKFFDIDPATRTATPISISGWGEGRLRRAHGFDRNGRYLLVLDDLGTLYVLEPTASGWTTRKAIAGAVPVMPAAAPFPAFAANGARNEVYLTDPVARQLVAIDVDKLEVGRRLQLDFKPSYAAWLGINR